MNDARLEAFHREQDDRDAALQQELIELNWSIDQQLKVRQILEERRAAAAKLLDAVAEDEAAEANVDEVRVAT